MQSIKNKLLISFLTVIVILIISGGFFMVMDFVIIKKYENLTNTMIVEYKLIETTTNLIESFHKLIKYINDPIKINQFIDVRKELKTLLTILDENITDYDSLIIYFGLKNTINDVIFECDRGVNAALEGNYSEITIHYDTANRKNVFVRENTASLLLKQLEYIKNLQTEITLTQLLTQIITLILFFIVVTGCVIYSILFSKKLISPLVNLTKLAKVIESGNLKATVSKDLLQGNDEIAVMANSFNTMIFSLRGNIKKLQEYNTKLIKARQKIDEENKELEKINKELASRDLTISQMKELDRMKNDILNIATHELKTPLISIVGLSEIMQKHAALLSPEYQGYINIIHEEGSKLTNLIRKMLTSIKRENNKSEKIREKFNLDDLLLSLETSLNMMAKRTNSQVTFNIGAKGIEIESNKEKISQVIYNFVDNAVKYGPSNQTIRVILNKPDAKFVKVAVSDAGPGISKEMRKKLFLKFSQLEPSLSRSQEGIGLGLFICKQNIEELGGQIGVESKPGHGATFYFTLPLESSRLKEADNKPGKAINENEPTKQPF